MTGGRAEARLLHALQVLEAVQQDVLLQDIPAMQAQLRVALGTALEDATTLPDEARFDAPTQTALAAAIGSLGVTVDALLQPLPWPQFAGAFLAARRAFGRALEQLYARRNALPTLAAFFELPGSSIPPQGAHPGGISHHAASQNRNAFSRYVPEYYAEDRRWPLVICLHGGHGHAEEYLWTWLRIARSRGMLLLSPKSVGPTWSIGAAGPDTQSILAMLDETQAAYRIDSGRVLLTGLSDGATFSLQLGLEHASRFSALAPIAGVMPPGIDRLLARQQGLRLPIHIVHGALDAIFAVAGARTNVAMLDQLGYAVTYTELLDWGHALTERINAGQILPWFEALAATR